MNRRALLQIHAHHHGAVAALDTSCTSSMAAPPKRLDVLEPGSVHPHLVPLRTS